MQHYISMGDMYLLFYITLADRRMGGDKSGPLFDELINQSSNAASVNCAAAAAAQLSTSFSPAALSEEIP